MRPAADPSRDRDEWAGAPPPDPKAWLALAMPEPAGPITTQSTQPRPDGTVLVRSVRDGVVTEWTITDAKS